MRKDLRQSVQRLARKFPIPVQSRTGQPLSSAREHLMCKGDDDPRENRGRTPVRYAILLRPEQAFLGRSNEMPAAIIGALRRACFPLRAGSFEYVMKERPGNYGRNFAEGALPQRTQAKELAHPPSHWTRPNRAECDPLHIIGGTTGRKYTKPASTICPRELLRHNHGSDAGPAGTDRPDTQGSARVEGSERTPGKL